MTKALSSAEKNRRQLMRKREFAKLRFERTKLRKAQEADRKRKQKKLDGEARERKLREQRTEKRAKLQKSLDSRLQKNKPSVFAETKLRVKSSKPYKATKKVGKGDSKFGKKVSKKSRGRGITISQFFG